MTDSRERHKQPKVNYTVNGTREGLLFRFDATAQPDKEKLGKRICAAVEQKVKALVPLLQVRGLVQIDGVWLGELERIDLEQRLSRVVKRPITVRLGAKERDVKTGIVHVGTLRGGMCLRADGDLTVVGDVHHGARLEASGNVVVLGRLEGAVLAGLGDADAVVAALQLWPERLRIADTEAPPVRKAQDLHAGPMLARVQGEKIKFLSCADKI